MISPLSRRSFLALSALTGVGLAGSSLMSGCSAAVDKTKEHQASNTLVVALPKDCEPKGGFNPIVSWGCGEHVHEPLIQSTLVRTNSDLAFENDLATSYKYNNGALTWDFVLRDDVKFSDGSSLTAHDVAFTLESIKNHEGSECDLSMIESVVVSSDTQLSIKLNKPFNALLYILANIGIVSKSAYSDQYGQKPLGSGRFMLKEWQQGSQAIFVPNPYYYGEAPKIKQLTVLFMEEDQALAAVKSHTADLAFTQPSIAKSSLEGYDLLNCRSVDSRGISLPMLKPGSVRVDDGKELPAGNAVTQDLAIRRALSYALNREALIKNTMEGFGDAAYSVSDGMPWSNPALKIETNVEYAKKIMDDAGWQVASDGIREKNGTRAQFDLLYMADDSLRQAIAHEFAVQMEELGIQVSPKGMTWDDIRPLEFSTPVVWGWGSNAPLELYYLNYSDAWGNFSGYNSAISDKYMDEALATPQVEDSFEFWQKSQWDGTHGPAPQGEASWVWIANVDHLFFVASSLVVAKQKPHPHGHGWSILNNVDEWYWQSA